MLSIRGIVFTILIYSSIFVLNTKGHRHSHHGHGHYPPPVVSPMTFDKLGNCFVPSVSLKGHCRSFHKCQSALQNWQFYQQMPFNCYTSGYDNIVCCPEAYVAPKNRKPPTVIESAENHQFLPNTHMSLNVRTRRSEEECEAIYSPYSRSHRRRHRSRRSSNSNSSQVANDEVMEPPTHDEIIIKKKVQDTEVVGGIAAHKNEFPYMCALGWRQSSSRRSEIRYHCGCVLIAPKYVLTVAHCADFGGESPKIVRLGGGDLNGRDDEMIRIRRIIQHPDYDSNYAYNDIAVVKLEKRSRIRPSCLWPNEGLPQEVVTAIGYGQTKFAGPTSDRLLKVRLNVLTNENCKSHYDKADKLPSGLDAGQICAGDPNGKMDTCQGDSGGPLLLNVFKYQTYVPYVVGLTSFGDGCATGIPSIYTRISAFIEWIENQVWK